MKISALLPLLLLSPLLPSAEKEPTAPAETNPATYRIEIIADPDDFALPPLTPFF